MLLKLSPPLQLCLICSILITHLTTAFAVTKLSSFHISKAKITADNVFIEFGTADILHACECFCMWVVFHSTESAGHPLKRRMSGRGKWIPPPPSGLVYLQLIYLLFSRIEAQAINL
ncbi:hypothetical protein M404DRAFT_971335, partial [Pisolithus tinctorius Marx 270]